MGTELQPPRSADLSVPEQAATFLVQAAAWFNDLKAAQTAARQTLRDEADRRGQRTFEAYGHRIVVDNPTFDRVYDHTKLHDGLADAGLDSERLAHVITYEPKVDGKIIRELERHPKFKAAIDAAILSVREKTRKVEVS